jgi:hypothetical protein
LSDQGSQHSPLLDPCRHLIPFSFTPSPPLPSFPCPSEGKPLKGIGCLPRSPARWPCACARGPGLSNTQDRILPFPINLTGFLVKVKQRRSGLAVPSREVGSIPSRSAYEHASGPIRSIHARSFTRTTARHLASLATTFRPYRHTAVIHSRPAAVSTSKVENLIAVGSLSPCSRTRTVEKLCPRKGGLRADEAVGRALLPSYPSGATLFRLDPPGAIFQDRGRPQRARRPGPGRTTPGIVAQRYHNSRDPQLRSSSTCPC